MRALVISNRTRGLIAAHIIRCAVTVGRQLRDGSWEILVDEDTAFALDRLSGDPDAAFYMICTDTWAYCQRCESRGPTIDEGETCARCKLVL